MSTRRRAMLALRITVSVAMLAFLLSRFDLSAVLPSHQSSTVPWIVCGLVVWFGAVMLSTVRWQRVLSAIELPSTLPPLISHQLAALFVSNFLPSTVGGDVLRVVRLSADNGDGPGSFASIILERLTGFVVLPIMTLAALLSHPALLGLGAASQLALLLSLATLGVLVVVLGASASPRLGGRLAGHAGWLRFAGAVHVGLDRVRQRPRAAAAALGVAFAYQATVVVAAWVACQALGIHVGWAPVVAFIPVVAIAQVLPISVGGLGLREGALVLLLQPLGVPVAKATALGLLLYGLNLTISLLGAPAFAVGPRDARALAA